MSFPIHRADLQDVASPKLNLDSVTLPESSTFVEKRVLTLSKQVTEAAVSGKKSVTLTVVIPANVEPVSAGLKVNFPDATIVVEGNKNGAERLSRGGPGDRATHVVVSWD
jgi:hypothetical protein